MIFLKEEATAAERRFPVYLVDATDGLTPETGEAAGQPQISKNGGAFANTSATLTAVGNGSYYVELTSGELDTLGMIQVRYKSANTAEFSAPARVIAYDPFDAVRLALTSLPNAAAAAAGGLFTRGTGAGQINQTANGTIEVNTVSGNVAGNVLGGVVGNVSGNVVGSVGSLATQAKADVNAEVLDVLNVDTFAEPGQEAPAATNTLAKKISYIFKFLRNKITQTATTASVFADDGTTVDQKSTVSDDGTTYTRGEWGAGP